MKKEMWIICLITMATVAFAGGKYGTAVTQGGKAKITFRVLDSEQRPVEKAQVQVGFYYNPEKQGIIKGETDTNGLCAVEGITCMDMWYSIEKNGYYKTDGKYVFGQVEPPVINNHWQPWNPTNTTILKEVKNPVPMYVKRVQIKIPVENNPIGFDLEKGDWVSPYGGGQKNDFLVTFSRIIRGPDDYENTMKVVFSNEKDGIQEIMAAPVRGMSLRLSHEAPQTGYQSNWVQKLQRKLPQGFTFEPEKRDDRNYFFRIRTVLDKDGNIESALYGKIYGSIDFAGYCAEKATLIFTYYLNPTSNDRNIEFDPEKNLFGGDNRFAP